jgi:hypothetical protein
MPPPVQKSGVTNTSLYVREAVRTVRTDPNASDIVASIDIPPSSTFQLVSRVVGRSGEDRGIAIWYQSTAGSTDSGGSMLTLTTWNIDIVNTMGASVVIDSNAPGTLQVLVGGDRLVYWTCATTLYVSQVP